MKPLDKNYLSLQFWNYIHNKNGTEFQSFFENIMAKAFIDFQKIRPYGKEGDGGNDGYIKKLGFYFQVYAPDTPAIKEAEAAKKLTEDFHKLKKNWSQVSEIKKYYFVYNDKNIGSTQKLELAITNLEKDNPNIEFEIFNSKKLEETLFTLDSAEILNLGFHIDSRTAIENAYEYIKRIEIALGKEYGNYALKLHSEISNIIGTLGDEQLEYEYELLKGRCLHKTERVQEAKLIYTNLSKRYPEDPRSSLYLAEICLFEKDQEKNQVILDSVSKDHWLHQIEVLVRKITIGENIDVDSIDEKKFPSDPIIKSNYYRLYSLFIEKQGDLSTAESFIEKAIHLNPNRLNNFITKLSFLERKLFSSLEKNVNLNNDLNEILKTIEKIEKEDYEFSELNARSQATILLKKLNVYRLQEDMQSYEQVANLIFQLILKCTFDQHIDNILVALMWGLILPKNEFEKLIDYLEQTQILLSDNLSQLLIIQFLLNKNLFTTGKSFFQNKNATEHYEFICAIEEKNYSKVLTLLGGNIQFSIALTDSLQGFPELRKIIIDSLPEEYAESKDKLLLLHYFDEDDSDNAFKILKRININALTYVECKTILKVVQKNDAWDLEIIIIKKLLEHEKDDKIRLNLKLRLFQANFNLTNYLDVINIGLEILKQQESTKTLDPKSVESVLAQSTQSYLLRGEEDKALQLLNKYKSFSISPEFKVSIETDVYLKNNMPQDALNSLVLAAKIKNPLSPEEYASLFFILVQIENQTEYKLESLEEVVPNCFVKLSKQDRFYYIGEGEELDSSKINAEHEYYNFFIGKKIDDEIEFTNKYSSKENVDKIQFIFTIEKYLLWKSSRNFEQLSREGRWAGAKMIEVPPVDDTIDTQYLEAFLIDEQKPRNPLFEMYCDKNIPLAMLALNEGGLPNAISRITQENKGFIKFSSGIVDEMKQQYSIAEEIIENKSPFILDGTSALFLSEIGYIVKIHPYLPNLKVPQSVITMLLNIADKFRISPGSEGSLGYAQGRINYSKFIDERRNKIRNNIYDSVRVLESNKDNILTISKANKLDVFSESKMLSELCDACIFAQNMKVAILTEDYYYLQMNEFETKKKAPSYFPSIILLRTLYFKHLLSFDDYLKYFGYLSSYRSRFLSFNADDIYKAVFGDDKLLKVRPEYIRQLNFPLTLSKEYGVPDESALKVLVTFLLKIFLDDSLSIDTVEKIFLELLNSFPKDKFNKEFSVLLIKVCVNIINKNNRIVLSKTVQNKVDKYFEITNVFNYGKERSFLF